MREPYELPFEVWAMGTASMVRVEIEIFMLNLAAFQSQLVNVSLERGFNFQFHDFYQDWILWTFFS